VEEKAGFRDQVFAMLGHLEVLDGTNKQGEEILEDESEYSDESDEENFLQGKGLEGEGEFIIGEEEGELSPEEESEEEEVIYAGAPKRPAQKGAPAEEEDSVEEEDSDESIY